MSVCRHDKTKTAETKIAMHTWHRNSPSRTIPCPKVEGQGNKVQKNISKVIEVASDKIHYLSSAYALLQFISATIFYHFLSPVQARSNRAHKKGIDLIFLSSVIIVVCLHHYELAALVILKPYLTQFIWTVCNRNRQFI